MASIRKNKSGTYTASVYVGRDANGKILREYITCPGWHECKTAAREKEEEIKSRSLNKLTTLKMSEYMDKWLEVNRGMFAPSTYQTYKIYIETHFKPYFKRQKVSSITDMHIKQYITEKSKSLSPTTVRKHFFTLRKMFWDAVKYKSPCLGVKAPKMRDYKPRVPTEAEFDQIHKAFKKIGMEEEIIILLAGWCGFRRGEIYALKWNDIDWIKGEIRVDETMAVQEESCRFALKPPKSANSIRAVAAPDYLMDRLKEQEKKRLKNVESITGDEVLGLFILTLNPYTFSRFYTETVRENKLPKIRLHDLRHYHASLLYKHNVPDHYAAERLGHDIWVLKKIYQHLGLEDKKELDEKVKGLFK